MVIDPCKNCEIRQWYAMKFDIHFWGEDCLYICEEYKRYEENETDKQKVEGARKVGESVKPVNVVSTDWDGVNCE